MKPGNVLDGEGAKGRVLRRMWWWALAWWFLGTVRVIPPPWVLTAGIPNYGYYRYAFVHWAYSDVIALYTTRDFYTHALPYVQHALEYPVGIGVFTWLTSWGPGVYGYIALTALGLGGALAVSLGVLARGRGARAALWWAASPLLLIFGLLNWDLLGIAALGLALCAYRGERFGAAGLWLGLGTVIKFFPIVYVPYLALALWPRRERTADFSSLVRFLGGFLVVAVGANLPLALWARRGWLQFFLYNSQRPPDPGFWSWLVAQGWLHLGAVDTWTLLATVAGGLALLGWGLRTRRDPLATAAMALIWWFLCNKTWSPQYMLWALYALLWTDAGNSGSTMWMAVAGFLDFGMAMVWLALGQLHSPAVNGFGSMVAPWVIAFRDATLLAQLAVLAKRGRSLMEARTYRA